MDQPGMDAIDAADDRSCVLMAIVVSSILYFVLLLQMFFSCVPVRCDAMDQHEMEATAATDDMYGVLMAIFVSHIMYLVLLLQMFFHVYMCDAMR